jgi:hypothetical protein
MARCSGASFGAVLLDVLVAIPAGVRGRNIRVPGHIHEGVAVAAVETELIHVNLVGKRNRLGWLVACIESLRSRVVGKGGSDPDNEGACAYGDLQRKKIGPAREEVGHGDVLLSEGDW